jgi:predicted O-methyltransferase YrrM
MDKNLLNFLKDLKQYGVKKNIPNISENVGQFLNILVKISKSKNILEIGCANGYSTIWLAEAVSANKGKITSIDFSKPSFDAAKNNLIKTGYSDIVNFHFGDALNLLPKIKNPKKFDFVFIDGEKRSYWNFWCVIKNRLADNAIVVFDDAILFPKKTGEFMKKIKAVVGFRQVVLTLDKDGGILLLNKNV